MLHNYAAGYVTYVMLISALEYQIISLSCILANLDLSAFNSLQIVYTINSSKFEILTTAGIEIISLDDAVKTVEPDVQVVHNFARANVPVDYIAFYRLEFLLTEKHKLKCFSIRLIIYLKYHFWFNWETKDYGIL